MRRLFLNFIVFVFISPTLFAVTPEKGTEIRFTENKGQIGDQNKLPRRDVLFSGYDKGLVFHLKNNGLSYQLSRVDSWKEVVMPACKSIEKEKRKVPGQTTIYRLDINWLNANPNSVIERENPVEGYDNYYNSSCPTGALEVKSYVGIKYKNIYNGIDLHYYGKDGHLKYDYEVSPGADYKQIQLEINGAQKISVNSKGELIIKTPLGNIVEQAPLVIQSGNVLKSHWELKNTIACFEIEGIDETLPFTIDPIVGIRQWGTYYGKYDSTQGLGTAIDYQGNVYMCGNTGSNGGIEIATSGVYQTNFINATIGYNAYIVKFNSSGGRLWGTYYGDNNEYGYSCAADLAGNVYMTGETISTTSSIFASPGAHQSTSGGYIDAFLVKFSSTGARLWATYYGGTGRDSGYGCSVDKFGNVFITGETNSSTNIASSNAYQTFPHGSFVAKFDLNGVRQWGTYYGSGMSSGARGCCNDTLGNVYIVGCSDGTSGIATTGSHQSTNGGGTDAFLLKLDSAGGRKWCTYYGGGGYDCLYSCIIDNSGNIYTCGYTSSGNNISTAGSHQPLAGGGNDAFLVKFDSTGIRKWGSFYGGSQDDRGYGCAVSKLGKVYLCGATRSFSNISTPYSHQFDFGLGFVFDGFIAELDTAGSRIWGTYYGTSDYDEVFGCVADTLGNVFMVGATESNITIATPGSFQYAFSLTSFRDAFLVKFSDCSLPPSPVNTTTMTLNFCGPATATLTATGTGTIGWYPGATCCASLGTGTVFVTPTLTNTTTYYVQSLTCGPSATRTPITVSITPLPNVNVVTTNTSICLGTSVTMTATGASSYTWSTGATTNTIALTPTINTSYSVIGINAGGCSGPNNTKTINITVNPNPTVGISTSNTLICSGQTATLTSNGANTYTWSTSATGSVVAISPTVTTNYSVTGTDLNGCKNTTSITQSVSACTGISELINQNGIIIYPNPATETINIQSSEKINSIKIFSVEGKLVLEKALRKNNTTLNVSELSQGIYFMLCITEGGEKYFKVVKE